jgi:flagellar protein FlgJ
MNISALHSGHGHAAHLEGIPLEQIAGNSKLSEEEKVKEVSRQFEAIILRQILGQARKTVFHSSMNQESTTSGIYQDMVTSQMADAISQSGAFGLARSLETQLTRQTVSAPPHPPSEPGTR